MKKEGFLLLSVLLLILSIILSSFAEIFSNKNRYRYNVEKVLERKIQKVQNYFIQFEEATDDQTPKIISSIKNESMILLKYSNDSLVFWSSNSIPINDFLDRDTFKDRIVNLYNSYYYTEISGNDSITYVGLINLVNRYPYENEFLHSGFNSSFKLPGNTDIGFDPDYGFPVYDNRNTYLFSIIVPKQEKGKGPQSIIATMFLFAGLILLGYYIFLLIFYRVKKEAGNNDLPQVYHDFKSPTISLHQQHLSRL